MKTLFSQVTTKAERNLRGMLAAFVAACLAFTVPPNAWSADLFWAGNATTLPTAAGSGTWVTGLEVGFQWSTATGALATLLWTDGNVAHFAGTGGGTVTLGTDITAAGITYQPGTGPFTIDTNGNALTLSGAGVANGSTSTQTITNNGIGEGDVFVAGSTSFLNASTAGNATINNDGDVFTVSGVDGGFTEFVDTSTAGTATITDTASTVTGGGGGFTEFLDTSTAGGARLTNDGSGVTGATAGFTEFLNATTAGAATIVNNGGTVAGGGGFTEFVDTSTAGSASITNNGATVSGGGGGFTQFFGTSTAATAAITNNGGGVTGAQGGFTEFLETSTAGSATITNNGGAASGAGGGFTEFVDIATAGSATITNNGGAASGAQGGFTEFNGAVSEGFVGSSTAGSATITNNGSAVSGGGGGSTVFNLTSTAASAKITNNGSAASGGGGGFTQFNDTSTAANATITNDGATANGGGGGSTVFGGTATAAGATITNNGGLVSGAGGGSTQFSGTSTAANATIINNGSIAGAAGGGGGSTEFSGTSTAGNATIITNGGTGGGAGGVTTFVDGSDGGTARAITNGNGRFDISGLTTAGMGIGSIEGSGNYFLGSKTLTVGGNNLSTTVSGVIQDGGTSGGTGGSLTKVGSGTLTLTGTNTYTGGTTITGGALQLGNGGTTGSIVGNVTDNASLIFDRSDTVTFGGLIGGTGTVTQAGTGTTILTNNNTYTGGTIISGGTLQLGNGGTTGGIVGNVTDNGTLAFDRSDVVTFPGVISGAGSVTQAGTGTTILTGNNTYTGGTTISAGALQLGIGGTTGSIVGNVTDNGVLIFDHSNAITFPGVISGPGSVTQEGTGTLILTGNNTYTGATSIAAGSTLQLGVGGTTGSIVGNVADAGALVFDRADVVTLPGVISGPGSVTQEGTGTTILTGNNTYTGGTIISAGTLQLGNGGTTGGVVGDIVDDGTLVVDRSNTLTLAGVISGTGGLQQDGPGTLILTGHDTYTGATVVNAGSLIVDGSIASPLTTVNAGGLLGGSGVIGVAGGSLVNSGIVSPGDPVGTLTVPGNYTQTAGGTLRINLAPTGTSLLAVGGVASLAGAVQLVPTSGFRFTIGERLTLLTAAGGVNGTFTTLLNPFFSGTIVEGALVYLLDLVAIEGAQGSFTVVAQTPNQAAVAHALDSVVGNPLAAALIGYLDTVPLGQLRHDLDLISPDELTVVENLGIALANVQTANIERRLGDIHAGSTGFNASGFTLNGRTPDLSSAGLAGVSGPEGKGGPSALAPIPENRWGVFVTGLGDFTNVGNTANAAGFDLRTGGVTLGADYRIGSNFAVGLLAGYAHTDAGLANGGDLEADGGKFGIYGTAFGHGFYADASVIGGYTSYDSRRGALLGQAHGSTDGGDLNVLVAGGYDWKYGNLTVGPTAGFQYTWINVGGFTEHGSLAPLHIDDQHADSYRTALGGKAAYDWKVGGILVKPEVSAAWQHEFGQTQYSVVSSFASGAGTSFGVTGASIGHDSLLVGAGVSVLWNDRIATYIDYDGELGRANYESNTVTAGVRVTF